jgi:hypothetical protein
MSCAIQDLWSNVVGSATHCLLALPCLTQHGGQPKVSHSDLHLCAQEEVAQLQVPVDDGIAMQIAHGVQQLQAQQASLWLCQPLAPLHQLHESLRGHRGRREAERGRERQKERKRRVSHRADGQHRGAGQREGLSGATAQLFTWLGHTSSIM